MTSQPITTSLEAERVLMREAELRKANRRFPSDQSLAEVLSRMLLDKGLVRDAPQILSRDRSGRSSTCANEVVTCRLDDGSELKLLCKYARANTHPAFGHRRGIDYEIKLYAEVLERLRLSTPKFYGSHIDAETNDRWLVMEYLEGGITVNKGPQPAGIISAAQWIGTFHARGAALLEQMEATDSFIQYDRDYFLGWPVRMEEFAEPLRERVPWLGTLCRTYMTDFVPRLLSLPRTLIHGEYTVHNVILRKETPADQWREVCKQIGGIDIAPIDWESAAISFPEIDLAFVTDGTWPEEVKQACLDQYKQFRWGTSAPADFDERLKAAQLYMHMRWLGDRPEKTLLSKTSWRFLKMEVLGRELGLI